MQLAREFAAMFSAVGIAPLRPADAVQEILSAAAAGPELQDVLAQVCARASERRWRAHIVLSVCDCVRLFVTMRVCICACAHVCLIVGICYCCTPYNTVVGGGGSATQMIMCVCVRLPHCVAELLGCGTRFCGIQRANLKCCVQNNRILAALERRLAAAGDTLRARALLVRCRTHRAAATSSADECVGVLACLLSTRAFMRHVAAGPRLYRGRGGGHCSCTHVAWGLPSVLAPRTP